MGRAIGQIIPLAVGVALSPLPIIAVILMVTAPSGRVTGLSFLAGWVIALVVLGTVVLVLADEAQAKHAGAPATWVSIVQVVLGVLLVITAARQWKGRPHGGQEPPLPGWMQKVETFSPPKAAAVAFSFAAVKPKNLLLTVGAATAIAETGIGTAQQAGAMAVYVMLASVGVGFPIAVYFLMGDRAPGILARLRGWMVRENQTIVAVICILIAAKLIGDAITGLAT